MNRSSEGSARHAGTAPQRADREPRVNVCWVLLGWDGRAEVVQSPRVLKPVIPAHSHDRE
jgi:hypothetical protein